MAPHLVTLNVLKAQTGEGLTGFKKGDFVDEFPDINILLDAGVGERAASSRIPNKTKSPSDRVPVDGSSREGSLGRFHENDLR